MNIPLPTDWLRVTPDLNNPIQIRVFDDGNKKYKQYENSWILFGMSPILFGKHITRQ